MYTRVYQFTTTEDGDLNICDTLLVIREPRPGCVLPMQEQFSKHASDKGRPRQGAVVNSTTRFCNMTSLTDGLGLAELSAWRAVGLCSRPSISKGGICQSAVALI